MMNFAEVLFNEKIKNIVLMPDSLNSKCINRKDLENYNIGYIQALNESDAVCICSGLNLSGTLSVCMMENSGIRSACDIISRFELSHGIHNIFLLTNRGELGEENWWGVSHSNITSEIIYKTNIKYISVKRTTEFAKILHNAVQTFKTEQISIAILLEYTFFEDIR